MANGVSTVLITWYVSPIIDIGPSNEGISKTLFTTDASMRILRIMRLPRRQMHPTIELMEGDFGGSYMENTRPIGLPVIKPQCKSYIYIYIAR